MPTELGQRTSDSMPGALSLLLAAVLFQGIVLSSAQALPKQLSQSV